ncbi:hypothetical protein ONZ45_g14176 [Pleurotus djamor]|nr:hypothetical protein ONZ45_g14176 [Pleurotus djamor]
MGDLALPAPASSSIPLDDGSARGYKDTACNHRQTFSQIAFSRRISSRRHANSSILYLSSNTLVKYGHSVHLSEAAALSYLASSAPAIPVPRLRCAFRDERTGVTYIVMDKIDGRPLSETWGQTSKEEKGELLTQLKTIFGQVRMLKKPTDLGIADNAGCAADGGKLHDHWIWKAAGDKGMGPFANEATFNLFLRNGVSNTDAMKDPEIKAEVDKLIVLHEASEAKTRETVFTHGDISLSNILVKDGKVVGIVDWEYTTAMNTHYIEGWREQIGTFLDEWPKETQMDDLWRKLYCDGP